jgi:hypothetical protein
MKKLLFILMFLPFIGFGQSGNFGEKTGCISGDCNNGYGTYIFSNGSKYVGEWRNDKQHGQGTYTWASGNKYVGEWKDGKRNGQGTQAFSDGSSYVGEYKVGEKHGQGTYTFKSGKVRKGKWINGVYQTPVKVVCNRKSKIAIAD